MLRKPLEHQLAPPLAQQWLELVQVAIQSKQEHEIWCLHGRTTLYADMGDCIIMNRQLVTGIFGPQKEKNTLSHLHVDDQVALLNYLYILHGIITQGGSQLRLMSLGCSAPW